MNSFRILILSAVRPSRTWRVAQRIAREIPGSELCGIAQQRLEKLPLIEQHIANDSVDHNSRCCRLQPNSFSNSVLKRALDWALWCIHGSAPDLTQASDFTVKKLVKFCAEDGWPLLEAEDITHRDIQDFIRQLRPDLAIVLGEAALSTDMLPIPSRGFIRARQSEIDVEMRNVGSGAEITIEHLTLDTESPFCIAGVRLPLQPYDGQFGLKLKIDLIANDLIIETARSLQTKTASQTSVAVSEWIYKVLSPYLYQLEPLETTIAAKTPAPIRFRPAWKLCVESLFSLPMVVPRNWYRRLLHRYPVLILTHHLISDRPHRMGMPTEHFWLLIRFLQKHYKIASISEATDLLRSGKISSPTVVLTFDDGYSDNFVSLRAVAEEAGIPVALFVTVEPIEFQRPFNHDCDEESRRALPLTWEQIRYWSCRGAEFESHTRTHMDCSSTDHSKLESEITGSKHDLEVKLGRPVRFFAFPFGQHENMSTEAIELARSAYCSFLSSFDGENLPCDSANQRHLFRKSFYGDRWELELQLQSVFDWIDAVKRRLRAWQVSSASFLERLSPVARFSPAAKKMYCFITRI